MHSLLLCTCLLAPSVGQVDERSLVGLWELTFYSGLRETNELWTPWIIDLHMSGDKLHGRVVATSLAQRGSELQRVEWANGRLRLKFTPNAEDKKSPYRRESADIEFDGVPAARLEDGVVGLFGPEYPAQLLRRDSPKVAKGYSGRQYFAPLQKTMDTLREMRSVVNPTALRDKNKRETAIRAGNAIVDRAIPQLEEALKHPDSRAVVEAAKLLVRQGVARNQPVERLAPWVRAGEQAARHYGPRHHVECTVQLAGTIPATAETAPLILELVQAAESSLQATHPLDLHCRVLWLKDAALRTAGDIKGSAALDDAWHTIEKRIQERHRQDRPLPNLTKLDVPPGENERPAVLQMIETPTRYGNGQVTQAAFDGLAATFGDRAIVYEYGWFPQNPRPPARLIHPGAIAADAFYTRLWVEKKSAFPVLLNGQFVSRLKVDNIPTQEIYDGLYTEMVSALKTDTGVKLNATAIRRGDKIEVQTQVTGLPKPGVVAVAFTENWSYTAWPGVVFSQHRVVRAKFEVETGNGGLNRFEFDLAKLERDLAPLLEGLEPWQVINPSGDPGASRAMVRARRWHEPYVIVMVWIKGELQQALQLNVGGF